MFLAACAVPASDADDDDSLDSVSSAIQNGWAVPDDSMLATTTVYIRFPKPETSEPNDFRTCTGVLIGRRHVLTAAHCKPTATGGIVRFYQGSTPDPNATASVTDFAIPDGVNPWGDYAFSALDDSDHHFADIAVLTLDSVPEFATFASFKLSAPAPDTLGYAVGTGNHDGQSNSGPKVMKYVTASTYTDETWSFRLDADYTDGGDSGGPFYTGAWGGTKLYVHGVVNGTVLDWGNWYSKYTMIAPRLPWILEQIGFPASNFNLRSGQGISGTSYKGFTTASSELCALACQQETKCAAFSHYYFPYYPSISLCYLMDQFSNWSAPTFGDPYAATSGRHHAYATRLP